MSVQLFRPYYRKNEVLKEIEECLDLGWTGLGFKTNKLQIVVILIKICYFL